MIRAPIHPGDRARPCRSLGSEPGLMRRRYKGGIALQRLDSASARTTWMLLACAAMTPLSSDVPTGRLLTPLSRPPTRAICMSPHLAARRGAPRRPGFARRCRLPGLRRLALSDAGPEAGHLTAGFTGLRPGGVGLSALGDQIHLHSTWDASSKSLVCDPGQSEGAAGDLQLPASRANLAAST